MGAVSMCPECEKGGREGRWRDSPMEPKGPLLDDCSAPSWDFLRFFDLPDIFRFRVWIPSFFMVRGRLML